MLCILISRTGWETYVIIVIHFLCGAQGEVLDWLFVATDALQFSLLAYDPTRGEILTKANGSVAVC